jgi:hypothetical protein
MPFSKKKKRKKERKRKKRKERKRKWLLCALMFHSYLGNGTYMPPSIGGTYFEQLLVRIVG